MFDLEFDWMLSSLLRDDAVWLMGDRSWKHGGGGGAVYSMPAPQSAKSQQRRARRWHGEWQWVVTQGWCFNVSVMVFLELQLHTHKMGDCMHLILGEYYPYSPVEGGLPHYTVFRCFLFCFFVCLLGFFFYHVFCFGHSVNVCVCPCQHPPQLVVSGRDTLRQSRAVLFVQKPSYPHSSGIS